MATPSGHIVDVVIKPGQDRVFNILMSSYNEQTKQWKLSRESVQEKVLLAAISRNRVNIENAKIADGKIVGNNASLARFNPKVSIGVKPLVIISELRTDDNIFRLLGYKVATFDGKVRNIKLNDMLDFCDKVTKQARDAGSNAVPIQNAIYVERTDSSAAHIKGYVQNQFIIEKVTVNKPTNIIKAEPNRNAAKQLSKVEEIFNKDQIEQLKLGKQNGVNIRIYGNAELPADKMKEIRLALESGIDPRAWADPRFSTDAMKAYRIQSKYGVNVSQFIHPAYNPQQIYELATAQLSGVNIAELADPKMKARDMAKKRIEMENEIWKDEEVIVLSILKDKKLLDN